MVSGGEVFERWLAYESGAPMNGISAFIKEIPEWWASSLPCEESKKWHPPAQKMALARTQPPRHPDLGLPEWGEINFCCLSPLACGILLRQPEWTNTSLHGILLQPEGDFLREKKYPKQWWSWRPPIFSRSSVCQDPTGGEQRQALSDLKIVLSDSKITKSRKEFHEYFWKDLSLTTWDTYFGFHLQVCSW